MPNSKQALKRLVTNDKRRLHNKTIRTSMRSAMKGVLSASDKEAGQQALSLATKRIDKAAKRHIIHANAAARYKSRLAQRVNQLG